MKLDVKATTFTVAIVWSLGIFLITWWIIIYEGPNTEPNFLSVIYRGYNVTPVGSLIGFLWAFFDGAIGGLCISWIYNSIVSNKK